MKVLKFLFLVLFFLFISCGDDRNCGEIVQKFTKNGKYYFAMIPFGGSSPNSDGQSGGDVFGDTEVTLDVYNSFNIGYNYCVD